MKNIFDWARASEVGATITYHRTRADDGGGLSLIETEAVRAAEEGLVFLSQQRRPDGGLDYRATRISSTVASFIDRISARVPVPPRTWRTAA